MVLDDEIEQGVTRAIEFVSSEEFEDSKAVDLIFVVSTLAVVLEVGEAKIGEDEFFVDKEIDQFTDLICFNAFEGRVGEIKEIVRSRLEQNERYEVLAKLQASEVI